MSDHNWPKHPDGRNKRIGEMCGEERDRVTRRAARKIQAELDDPTSAFRRRIEAMLAPDVSVTRH